MSDRLMTDAITRMLDLLFAILGLICAAPLFLVLVPLLRLTGEGEVFYRQSRIGRGGRRFEMLKFATMVKNSPNSGAGELTLPGDARVLPIGRVLRRSKLNEIPQLLNILTGDLSLIGPRPQTERYFDMYRAEDRPCIVSVRPGLSGVGSVIFRNEEAIFARVADPIAYDRDVMMPYKGELESWFVPRRSVILYFELLVATILVVLSPRAAIRRRLLSRVPPPPPALAPLL